MNVKNILTEGGFKNEKDNSSSYIYMPVYGDTPATCVL